MDTGVQARLDDWCLGEHRNRLIRQYLKVTWGYRFVGDVTLPELCSIVNDPALAVDLWAQFTDLAKHISGLKDSDGGKHVV